MDLVNLDESPSRGLTGQTTMLPDLARASLLLRKKSVKLFQTFRRAVHGHLEDYGFFWYAATFAAL